MARRGDGADTLAWLSRGGSALAVVYKILIAAFHMLQRSVGFADLGGDYLDLVNISTAKRLVRRLDALGYNVMLRPKVTA